MPNTIVLAHYCTHDLNIRVIRPLRLYLIAPCLLLLNMSCKTSYEKIYMVLISFTGTLDFYFFSSIACWITWRCQNQSWLLDPTEKKKTTFNCQSVRLPWWRELKSTTEPKTPLNCKSSQYQQQKSEIGQSSLFTLKMTSLKEKCKKRGKYSRL